MDHSKKATYLYSIDALRVIAILAVILIHVTTKTLSVSKFDILNLPLSLILNQSARFAVPLFFLISGFVLELNNKNSLSFINFFKKRSSRIIVPFIFWSCVYILISTKFDFGSLLNQKFFWVIILGNASYHLYFIPTLILFYLFFPLLHKIIKFLKNPFVIICIFFIQGFILYNDYYIKVIDLQYDLRIALLSFAMFILGVIGSHKVNLIDKMVKKFRIFIPFLLIFVISIINLHVFDMTLKFKTTKYIYNQYGPLNYIYTLILASFLFSYLNINRLFESFVIKLSKLTLFVFFIHVLVQNLLWSNFIASFIKNNGNWIIYQIWFDIAVFFIISIISFALAYFVHKIPFAAKITG